MFLLQYHYSTVEPWFNEPLYNKVLSVKNDTLQLGQSYSKMYGKEPWYNEPWYNKILVTMNTIQKPKHITYPKCQLVSFQMWADQQESKSVIVSLFASVTSTEICLPCFKTRGCSYEQTCTVYCSIIIDIKAQMLFTVTVPIPKCWVVWHHTTKKNILKNNNNEK